MEAVSSALSWWYNWHYLPDTKVASVYSFYNMDYVPMAWDENFNETGIRNFYENHLDAEFLLGFNEPNFLEQANMTPSQAAALWPKLEKIADDYGLKLVSPAVNWCGSCVKEGDVTFSNPITYLDSFFSACQGCRVDYIAVHNYMCFSGALASDLNAYKKYGKKIWLTEFACWDQSNITLSMQKSYMMGALDYLENDTMIYRYSWITDRDGKYPYLDLFKATSGELTDLGKLYVNFYPVHDTLLYTDIPARIEAENYSVKTAGVQLEGTSDVDGLANLGWINANDWMQYNINVPTDDNYYISLRVANLSATTLILREGSNTLVQYTLKSTGGWQNWKTVTQQIPLKAGKHQIQVYAPKGGFNINWLKIDNQPTSIVKKKVFNMVFPNPVTDKL